MIGSGRISELFGRLRGPQGPAANSHPLTPEALEARCEEALRVFIGRVDQAGRAQFGGQGGAGVNRCSPEAIAAKLGMDRVERDSAVGGSFGDFQAYIREARGDAPLEEVARATGLSVEQVRTAARSALRVVFGDRSTETVAAASVGRLEQWGHSKSSSVFGDVTARPPTATETEYAGARVSRHTSDAVDRAFLALQPSEVIGEVFYAERARLAGTLDAADIIRDAFERDPEGLLRDARKLGELPAAVMHSRGLDQPMADWNDDLRVAIDAINEQPEGKAAVRLAMGAIRDSVIGEGSEQIAATFESVVAASPSLLLDDARHFRTSDVFTLEEIESVRSAMLDASGEDTKGRLAVVALPPQQIARMIVDRVQKAQQEAVAWI